MIKVEKRLNDIESWLTSGKEHDFHEMNLVKRLDKAKKIDDFHNNYLDGLRSVVKDIIEFNKNSWKITTHTNREFLYYSTSGKIKENKYKSPIFKISYKSIKKFFSKSEFQIKVG